MGKKTKVKVDQQVTLVTFLLDRSGSMASILHDTIGGFNAYTDGLKQETEVPIEFSLVQFSSEGFQRVCVAAPIAEVPALSVENYRPDGWTPLIEAAYKTIQAVADSLLKRKDKPKVIVCIQTDGEENKSDQTIPSDEMEEYMDYGQKKKRPVPLYSWKSLKKLVEQKTAEGWQFNFLGTGIDAYAQGAAMGISAGSTMSASMDTASTYASYRGMGASTMRYAKGLADDTAFLAAERADAGDRYYDKHAGGGSAAVPVSPPQVSRPNASPAFATPVAPAGTIRTPLSLDPGGGGGAPSAPSASVQRRMTASGRSGLGGLDL